jgi:hypothetical protein
MSSLQSTVSKKLQFMGIPKDITRRPGNLSSQKCKSLNEDSSLNGHVKTPSNASTLKWLIVGVLCTGSHQTWHLILREFDLLAAKGSKTQVCDLFRCSQLAYVLNHSLPTARTFDGTGLKR